MFAILIALALLVAGVAAIYLLLKNMGEEGIDIAAPGSCKRGRCGVPSRPPVEQVEEDPPQVVELAELEREKANA